MKPFNFIIMRHSLLILAFTCLLVVTGCKDDNNTNSSYDPSRPVTFSDFSPKEGAVRARLYIYGDNFGTDVSRIKINVGGKDANIIGSNGSKIYCMVPNHAYDGNVTVQIMDENGAIAVDHTFDEEFTYVKQPAVGTLIRKVDEDGKSSNIDGTFAEASFNNPNYLIYDNTDGKKSLYVGEEKVSIRKIDLEEETVSTVITNAAIVGCKTMCTFCFSGERDTLFVTDDNGQTNNYNRANIYYMLRKESFKSAYPYSYDWCNYSCASHPIDHTMFYGSYPYGTVKKKEHQVLFEVGRMAGSGNQRVHLFIHPTGKYMYILGAQDNRNVACIYKSNYNETEKVFEYPTLLAGSYTAKGYVDGVGTAARFTILGQGVFVKNKDYEEAGKEDIYDFYVTDKGNHCIRKVTPQGIVTTFAGRGSASTDGVVSGYIDGDPLTEARFSTPYGIAYNEEDETFYIAETGNHSIRYIRNE